jgi:hypothetical protein
LTPFIGNFSTKNKKGEPMIKDIRTTKTWMKYYKEAVILSGETNHLIHTFISGNIIAVHYPNMWEAAGSKVWPELAVGFETTLAHFSTKPCFDLIMGVDQVKCLHLQEDGTVKETSHFYGKCKIKQAWKYK